MHITDPFVCRNQTNNMPSDSHISPNSFKTTEKGYLHVEDRKNFFNSALKYLEYTNKYKLEDIDVI